MARKIKLQDTGEVVDKLPGFYKVPKIGYFSSYDAYLAWDLIKQQDKQKKKEEREAEKQKKIDEVQIESIRKDMCYDKMLDLMGLQKGQQLSTYFNKRLKEWRVGYDYQTIYKAMELSTERINYVSRTKQFNNEQAKLVYVMAIINNQLNDAVKLIKAERMIDKTETNKDLEMFTDGIDLTQTIRGNIKSRDVSNLTGDL